jgi:hypothetical protein
MLTLVAAAAGADAISAPSLQANHQACMSGCTGQHLTAASCKPYCDCSMNGVRDSFSGQEFQALLMAIDAHQQPAATSLAKLKVIEDRCRASMPK